MPFSQYITYQGPQYLILKRKGVGLCCVKAPRTRKGTVIPPTAFSTRPTQIRIRILASLLRSFQSVSEHSDCLTDYCMHLFTSPPLLLCNKVLDVPKVCTPHPPVPPSVRNSFLSFASVPDTILCSLTLTVI